jgi:hypothetical protein
MRCGPAPKAGGAELQATGESLHQFVRIPFQQRHQFGSHVGVGFGGEPALGHPSGVV